MRAVEQLCTNSRALENGQTSCTYPELDVTREHLLANFNRWRDKERERCESELVLEERVVEIFGMSSTDYRYHAAGLAKGKEVWGTVLDLGLYTMFLDVRVMVVHVGQIRGVSSDEELLQSCFEAVFPGECEKHRVVCAVCFGDHWDIGAVFDGPKARTIFDVGEDWTCARGLILNYLRACIVFPKPKVFWKSGPEQTRKLTATPLLNDLRASAAAAAFTGSQTALAGAGGRRRGGAGCPEHKLCRRERWDLERVQLLLDKLHTISPLHYDVRILQFVKDHADKDGFLTVRYKYAKGTSCGRLFSTGLSFQSCTVATRSFCSARFYVEDDLVNAFPTIMSQVFKQAGLSSPFLDEYVARREEVFEEIKTDTLSRSDLKKLFLVGLHGGDYFHHTKFRVPFLDRFQRELKSCTRKLLGGKRYAYLKHLALEKENHLGSAIALISQTNESKIMAAKTVFTERSCKVATDLFDGHLREIGALDMDECAKFVERETGFKVKFEVKSGLNVWVDGNIEISSIPPLSLQLAAPTVREFYPPHTATVFSSSTSSTLTSSSASSITLVPTASVASAASGAPGTAACARFNDHCPGSPAWPPSKYCHACTDLYLRSKYGFARSFGERSNVALPKGCTHEALVADIRICGEAHQIRAKLQSWAASLKPSAREAALSVSSFASSTRCPSTLPSSTTSPALPSSDPPSPPASPPRWPCSPIPALAFYDVTLCDRACPLCEKTFNSRKLESARKELAKHVNDHLPDPTNARLKAWLEAANRAWCTGCQLSYGRRQTHQCHGPRAVASFAPRSGAARVLPAAIDAENGMGEFKGEDVFVSSPSCLLPSLMDIFSTSIPTVKRIPQKCRVSVAKAYTTVMRHCSTSGSAELEMRAWKMQFLFAKCVLRQQPEVRGGKKKKLRRNRL